MSIVADVLIDLGGSLRVSCPTALQALHDLAFERVPLAASEQNLTVGDCLGSLDREHEPEPSEVRQFLPEADVGCWRATLRLAAVLATQARLESEIDSDLDAIAAAMEAVQEAGFKPVALCSASPANTVPFARENELAGCIFYTWLVPGEASAGCLRVGLTGNRSVWLTLKPGRSAAGPGDALPTQRCCPSGK